MKIKYKDKITGEIQINECTEIDCKNVSQCEDGCLGFITDDESIEVIDQWHGSD